MLGLVCAAVGLVAAAFAPTVPLFALALVPLAFGIGFGHPTMSSLVSRVGARRRAGARAGRRQRGREPRPDDRPGLGERVAAAVRRGEPYLSAAVFLIVTLALAAGLQTDEM